MKLLLSNIWNHPRTSVTGVLIGVVTICGVLAQQGISLGQAGTGTVVTLAGGLASALLGLLARDPAEETSKPGGTSRLGAWVLIALLLPLAWGTGCNGASAAENIVDWMPALQSAVITVDSTAALLAPKDAPQFTAATAGFDAAAKLLVAQALAYLANPSATTLEQLQAQVVNLQQQVDGALLQAARIVDPASQQHALATVQAVATIVSAVLALLQPVSTREDMARMAKRSTIKQAQVQPLLDSEAAARQVAAHYGEPVALARMQVAQASANMAQAGM